MTAPAGWVPRIPRQGALKAAYGSTKNTAAKPPKPERLRGSLAHRPQNPSALPDALAVSPTYSHKEARRSKTKITDSENAKLSPKTGDNDGKNSGQGAARGGKVG